MLRVRLGKREPSRRFVTDITRVISNLIGEPVQPTQLFERADLLLAGDAKRLRAVHATELRTINYLIAHPEKENWVEVVLDTVAPTETAARHLYYAGRALLTSNPEHAAQIFLAASLTAAKLSDTPIELKKSLGATALKGRGNALRHLGQFDDALANLRTAARLYIDAKYCESEAARVEYSRGAVLFVMERWRDATEAASNALDLARAVEDLQLVAHCMILLGSCHFEQGDTTKALDMFVQAERLLANDEGTRARVWLNLAAVDIRLNRRGSALEYLNRAAATFRKRGYRLELARANWNLGTYHAKFTDAASGLRLLRNARRTFSSLKDRPNAACVALDILEIQSDRAVYGDRHLARFASLVADELFALGLAVSATNALDQLRRLAVSRNRRSVIDDIRAALRDNNLACSPTWAEATDQIADTDEAETAPGLASGD